MPRQAISSYTLTDTPRFDNAAEIASLKTAEGVLFFARQTARAVLQGTEFVALNTAQGVLSLADAAVIAAEEVAKGTLDTLTAALNAVGGALASVKTAGFLQFNGLEFGLIARTNQFGLRFGYNLRVGGSPIVGSVALNVNLPAVSGPHAQHPLDSHRLQRCCLLTHSWNRQSLAVGEGHGQGQKGETHHHLQLSYLHFLTCIGWCPAQVGGPLAEHSIGRMANAHARLCCPCTQDDILTFLRNIALDALGKTFPAIRPFLASI